MSSLSPLCPQQSGGVDVVCWGFGRCPQLSNPESREVLLSLTGWLTGSQRGPSCDGWCRLSGSLMMNCLSWMILRQDCSVSISPSIANKEINKEARNEPLCNLPTPSFYFSLKLPPCIYLHSAAIWNRKSLQKQKLAFRLRNMAERLIDWKRLLFTFYFSVQQSTLYLCFIATAYSSNMINIAVVFCNYS